MCSKPNPADAAECAFCGARLKPLVIGAGPADLPRPEPPGEGAPSPDADWLSRLRGPEEPEVSALGPAEPAGAGDDWLARLRATDPQWDAGAPASGPAPSGTPAEAAPAEGPDWLGRLRQADSGSDFGPPEGEVPEWLRPSEQPESPPPQAPPPSSADDVPDWLARIREKQALEREASADLPPKALPDRAPRASDETPEVPPAGPAEADVFDLEQSGWHSGLTGLLEPMPESGEAPEPAPTSEPDVFDLEKSDWHSGLTGLLEPMAESSETLEPAPTSEPDVFDLEKSDWHSGLTGLLEPLTESSEAPEPTPTSEPDVFDLEKSDWHSGLTGLLEQPEGLDRLDKTDTMEHGGLTGLLPSLDAESRPVQMPEPPVTDQPSSRDVFDLEKSGWHSGLTGPLEPLEAMGEAGPAVPSADLGREPPAKAETSAPGSGPAGLQARLDAEGTPKPARPTSSLTDQRAPRQGAFPGRTRDLQPSPLGIAPPPAAPVPPLPSATPHGSTAAFEGEPLAREIGAGAAGSPDWLTDLGAPPEEPRMAESHLPHVAALISDAGAGSGSEAVADIELGSIEVPDWLADARAPGEPGAGGAGEARSDLAPATLPAWLEAMRPVETFRSVVEITPEDEQAIEAAGPLAGLRGVLLAEPVVAMPRAASLGAGRLNVTERQYAQAELLRRLVEEEQRESPARTRTRPRPPILRWGVGALLVMAVTLSVVFGFPAFPLPGVEPRELAPLVGLIDSLPTDRPALLVFDYEPGYMAEMDAVAGALVTQLMTRNVPIATMSTRPTGPPLAESLIGRLAQLHGYVNGQNYVHLGYLSGGIPAVQLFAAAPRDSLLSGFVPAEGQTTAAGWSSPILAGVQRLSDFAMVGVITAGADSARLWTEQASPWMGGRPLVMVLSAGTEPLVRPYFESLQPQVNGLLTGLPAAVAYEIHNGQPGPAQARWNGFGAGMLTVELVIVAGAVYGLAMSVLGMRRRRTKAGGA